jgi:hypothetical protein
MRTYRSGTSCSGHPPLCQGDFTCYYECAGGEEILWNFNLDGQNLRKLTADGRCNDFSFFDVDLISRNFR